MTKSCCRAMRRAVRRTCPDHPDRKDCPDCLVAYEPESNEYGLMIHDGGSSVMKINFCPWCGRRLRPLKKRMVEPR